jgi:hypothetical protein
LQRQHPSLIDSLLRAAERYITPFDPASISILVSREAFQLGLKAGITTWLQGRHNYLAVSS